MSDMAAASLRTVTASELRDPEVLAAAGRAPVAVYDARRQETLVLTSRAAYDHDQRLHHYLTLLAQPEYYQQAIALDANYALAYAGLADSYVQGVWHVPFVPEEVLPQAKAAALQAVALDDLLAEAHTALAGVYAMEWNWGATGRELQRAIELNPNYARAYHAQAFHLMVTGHKDEAVAAIERARSLDPLNLVVNTDIANIFFGVRRVDEALRQWEKTLELDPNFALVYRQRAEAYIFKGDEAAAATDYLKEMELNGEAPAKIAASKLTILRRTNDPP